MRSWPHTRWTTYFPLILLALFSIFFSYDIVILRRFLSQPDLSNYFFPYRQWFVGELARGSFPLWNPYWGLGQPVEWFLAIPLDFYTPFELVFGPHYHYLYPLQLFILLCLIAYAFRKSGCGLLASAVCSILFFLIPNTNHWYYYFLIIPAYVANALSFIFLNHYFKTQNPTYLFRIFWVFFIAMFGTKAEFWFQNAAAYVFYSLALVTLKPEGEQLSRGTMVRRALMATAPLGLAALAHAWQINITWRLLNLSGRTVPAYDPLDLLRTLAGNLSASSLVPVVLISGTLLAALDGSRRKWLVLVCAWVLILTAVATTSIDPYQYLKLISRQQRILLASFVKSPAFIGAVLGFAGGLLLHSKPRWRLEAKTAALFFLFVYYWSRPGEGDAYGEMTVIRTAPASLAIVLSSLVWLGLRRFGANRWARLSYFTVLFVLLMRDQGQIPVSFVLGIVWVPQRDSYLIDFAWSLLACVGLHESDCRAGVILRRSYPYLPKMLSHRLELSRSLSLLPFATLAVLVSGLFPNPYFAHWMMDRAPPDYPYYGGVPAIREIFRALKESGAQRIFVINKPTKSQTFGYGESLLEGLPQVSLYSSVVPKNFRDWTFYQRTKMLPQDWLGYNSAFTPQMLARLPKREDVGLPNDLLYFYTVIARPSLDGDILRLLGVTHILYFKQSLDDPTVSWFDLTDKGHFQRALEALRLTDIRELSAGYYVPNMNPQQTFVPETLVVGRLEGALGRAFTVRGVTPESLSEFTAELSPRLSRGSVSTQSFSFLIGPATIHTYKREYIAVSVESEEEVHLVLTDILHPYWKATVDGRPAQIIPAFYVLRAVKLPPGRHVVEMRYEFPGLYVGVAISIFVVVAMSVANFASRSISASGQRRKPPF